MIRVENVKLRKCNIRVGWQKYEIFFLDDVELFAFNCQERRISSWLDYYFDGSRDVLKRIKDADALMIAAPNRMAVIRCKRNDFEDYYLILSNIKWTKCERIWK